MLNKKLLMGISNIEEIDTENELVFTLADKFDVDGNRFSFYEIATINNDRNNFNFYANNEKVNISSYSFKPNTQVIVKSRTNNFNYSGNFCQQSWGTFSDHEDIIFSQYFFLAKSIDQPLPQWINTTNNTPITNFSNFFHSSKLSSVPYNLFENNDQITSLDRSFDNCTNLTTAPDIPNNVTVMYGTFYNCGNLVGTMNIYSKEIYNSRICFYKHFPAKNLDVYLPVCYDNHVYTTTFNSFKSYTVNRVNGILVQDINNIDYSQPEFSMQLVVNTNINNSFKMYNIFGEWDIDYDNGNVVHYAHTYNSNITYNYTNNGIYNITITNANISSISFRNTLGLTEVKSPLPKLHIANIVNMFSNCSNLTTVPLNLFENNQEIFNLSNCFSNCTNLLIAPDLNFKSDSVNFSNMFRNCKNLVTPPEINCLRCRADFMFTNCTSLSSIPANIKNSDYMYVTFHNCRNLSGEISINFVYNVSSCNGCFSNCNNLTKIALNGTNLSSAFFNTFTKCTNLKSVSLTGLPNKIQSRGIFDNCYNLEDCPYQEILNKSSEKLTQSFCNCSNLHMNITYIPNDINDLYRTFKNCTNLTNICDLDHLTNCNNIAYCFQNCTNLSRLPKLPSSIINAAFTFFNCSNIVQNMSEYIIPENISDMSGMFSRCTNIYGTVTLPNNVIDASSCFDNCYSITEIVMSNNLTDIASMCGRCYNLVSVSNIPQTVTNMAYAFNKCSNLQGNLNILSTNIINISGAFSNHNYNKPTPLPLNVYIYTHYDNGVQTTTYNTFLNDTSHSFEFRWVLDNTTHTGITLKSFNKKTTITPNITDGSTLFIYGLEKDISEPFICYSKQLEYYCYHPNYPAKQGNIDLSDIGDTYTLTIDMTSYNVETELLTITIPEEFTATTEINYGLYTYTSTSNTIQVTVENGTEVTYIVKDIVNISDPSIQYGVQRDTLTVNGYITIAITPEEVVVTNINLSYPFTTYSEFLDNLVDDNNFIIDSNLSAIVSGPSSFNKNSGTSYGYIEFTTPNIETTLSITGYVSSESSWDYGAIYLGSVQYKPTQSQIKNKTLNSSDTGSKYLYNNSGNKSSTTITETLQPNTKYVVSFAYCKDSSGNTYQDRLIITNIQFTVLV